MKQKDLKIDFRYLTGNIACLSVDSISGESVHNDINNEEAIIIFNSLVGKKADCQTVKSLLKDNVELKKQLEETDRKLFFTKNELDMRQKSIDNKLNQQKEFIEWLKAMKRMYQNEYKDIDTAENYNCVLKKYKSIIGVSDEKEN